MIEQLPNFLVIGAMKAGTTSLSNYLGSHPQVFMTAPKEIEFFSRDDHWERGLQWYARHFDAGRACSARGEASTGYTMSHLFPAAPQRIASTLPEARLVYMVRDPIERIRSHYEHAVLLAGETRSIAEAVLSDPSYIETSSYGRQVERYLALFERSQLLVVDADSLRAERAPTMRRIYSFVGVDATWRSPILDQEFYVTDARTPMRPSLQAASRLAPVRALSRHVPSGIKRKLLRVGAVSPRQRRQGGQRARVPDHLRDELRRRLEVDVRQFRELTGAEVSHWGYDA